MVDTAIPASGERAKAFMGQPLAHRLALNWLAVGIQNLHLVHAAFVAAAIGPDDFFFWGYFEQLHIVLTGRAVTGDDGVAVGEALGAAGIVEKCGGQVG